MSNELYTRQIKNLEKIFSNTQNDIEKKLIDEINLCSGMLYFTGVGKNGHVASLSASTFASIGIKSAYINPVEAVHGDMGNLNAQDIIFGISKSGNTEELNNFLYNVRKNNPQIKIILLHSNKNALAKKYSDIDVCLENIQEIDEYDIVPTTSIVAYTMFLQNLGINLSKLKNFSLQKFKKNHPGGNIGVILKDK